MPRHEHTYPARMIKTDEGKSLYAIWRRIRYNSCEAFSKYPDFFEWAIQSGFIVGARLRRHDNTIEYGPDNCSFTQTVDSYKMKRSNDRLRANEWNKTVNRIRIAYGMKPFETTEGQGYGI